MVEICRPTRDTLRSLLKIKVAPSQEGFVANNAVTMAQSIFEPGSEVFGLWDGEQAVGLIAIIDFAHPEQVNLPTDDPAKLYVWRLMIADDVQRQGYGQQALAFAEDMARERDKVGVVLAAVDKEGTAVPFYQRNGYHLTGRVIEGEVEMEKPFA